MTQRWRLNNNASLTDGLPGVKLGGLSAMQIKFAHCELLKVDFKRARRFCDHRWLKAMDEFPAFIDACSGPAVHLQDAACSVPSDRSTFFVESRSNVDVRLHGAMQSGQP